MEYYFLVSSLPLLTLGEKPRHSSAGFLELCREHLSTGRLRQLAAVGLLPGGRPCCGVDSRWQIWETYARNCVTRVRATRLEVESEPWLQPESDVFPSDGRVIEEILATEDPAARELALDKLRWQRLGDFAVGHEFDFDALVAYRLHLLLAEKWAELSREQGRHNMARVVDSGTREAESKRRVSELVNAV